MVFRILQALFSVATLVGLFIYFIELVDRGESTVLIDIYFFSFYWWLVIFSPCEPYIARWENENNKGIYYACSLFGIQDLY